MNRIDETFHTVRNKRAALMPYIPLGYPTLALSVALMRAAQDAGADILELGVPFSDPLADGPVIQHATQVALENGMDLKKCLSMVQAARAHGVTIPLVLMGYYNPLLQYDLKTFARDAFEVGADGVIVPDLPLEEADDLHDALRAYDLDLIFLAAPTSSDDRLKKIGKQTRGFVYLVSLTGVTGARAGLPEGLEEFVQRARQATDKPVCVGFGIADAENAKRVAHIADGVIVGSALVQKIGDASNAVENARAFVAELAQAIGSKSEIANHKS
jgi:tryptophan synthase alpha chain